MYLYQRTVEIVLGHPLRHKGREKNVSFLSSGFFLCGFVGCLVWVPVTASPTRSSSDTFNMGETCYVWDTVSTSDSASFSRTRVAGLFLLPLSRAVNLEPFISVQSSATILEICGTCLQF